MGALTRFLLNRWSRHFLVPCPKFDWHFTKYCIDFFEKFWWGILGHLLVYNLTKKNLLLRLYNMKIELKLSSSDIWRQDCRTKFFIL